MTRISAASCPYTRTDVSCTLPDGTVVDPTSYPVSFAFLATGAVPTTATTWTLGSWDETGAGFTARILVGPASLNGQVTLSAGDYDAFVKIAAAPETIILPVGPVTIY
jgi:hypothetical protein